MQGDQTISQEKEAKKRGGVTVGKNLKKGITSIRGLQEVRGLGTVFQSFSLQLNRFCVFLNKMAPENMKPVAVFWNIWFASFLKNHTTF